MQLFTKIFVKKNNLYSEDMFRNVLFPYTLILRGHKFVINIFFSNPKG